MIRGAHHRPYISLLLGLTAVVSLAPPANGQRGISSLAAEAAPANIAAPSASGTASESAVSNDFYIPDISALVPNATSRESISSTLQIVVIMTFLTVLPSILLMMTCFTRIVIVLALLRQAIGAQSLPPAQVLVGLGFFLTVLVMAPTGERIKSRAIDPYLAGTLPQMDAIAIASEEMRGFMLDQIEATHNEDGVYMLVEYAQRREIPVGEHLSREDVPMTALIPAFILSELKTAFVLGFKIYLPFLVIDMVIATVLVSMGMMMLPPVLISLPFKLLLFVLSDGWHLVTGSLMASIV